MRRTSRVRFCAAVFKLGPQKIGQAPPESSGWAGKRTSRTSISNWPFMKRSGDGCRIYRRSRWQCGTIFQQQCGTIFQQQRGTGGRAAAAVVRLRWSCGCVAVIRVSRPVSRGTPRIAFFSTIRAPETNRARIDKRIFSRHSNPRFLSFWFLQKPNFHACEFFFFLE